MQENVLNAVYYETANAYVPISVPSPPIPSPFPTPPFPASRDPETSRRVPEHFVFALSRHLCSATPQKLLDRFRCLTLHFEDESEC